MFYENELRLVREVFRKCHLQTLVLGTQEVLDSRVDLGLRQLLVGESAYGKSFSALFSVVEKGTFYHLVDAYLCQYLYFLLPDAVQESVLLVGPYLGEELRREQILEQTEQLHLPPHMSAELERYYAALPILPSNGSLSVMLDTFVEQLWGSHVKAVDIRQESEESDWSVALKKEGDPIWNRDMMQMRYDYENELMLAVEQGQGHKVNLFLESFSHMAMEQRSPDPLRNIQNYCIIMNTLSRKAAERGGVHPIYLDKVSSEFAHKIERLSSVSLGPSLMREMFRTYCRLVRKHSMKNYSAPIQKAIALIDADLTADLSLHALATAQNISDGYLSSLFRRETGQTLTQFVNERRMKAASRLLTTTKLQIQTVAQHCGIVDVHYFSRLFKKHTGMTPLEYRESHR